MQGTCGSVYGVVPFVSRRSTGIVCGLVSAGGAVGGVINQAIFFLNTPTKGAYGAHSGLRDARAACRWPCMLGVPGWPICVPSHLADWLVKPAGALCEPVPCKLCVCVRTSLSCSSHRYNMWTHPLVHPALVVPSPRAPARAHSLQA